MNRVTVVALIVIVATSTAAAQERSPASAGAAPPDAAESRTGEQLFSTSCGFCHQDGGRVAGRGPKLAGTERTDEYLLNRIRVGKEGAMPAFGRAFTDTQIKALVAYIRSLKDEAR